MDEMTSRERVHNGLAHHPTDRLPLLPLTMQFAARHSGVPYRTYATDHTALVAAQIRTAEAFSFDHVSCASDPTREICDLAGEVRFFGDQPPALDESKSLLCDKQALADLPVPDPHREGSRLHDRLQALHLFVEKVGDTKIIEGCMEGPASLACHLRGINRFMLDLVDDPGFVTDLMEYCVRVGSAVATAQIEAGADWIALEDASAALLGPAWYAKHIWPYEQRLVDLIHDSDSRVRLHICGNIHRLCPLIARLGCDVVDIDHLTDLGEARQALGRDQVLHGNLDPVGLLMNGQPEGIINQAARCRADAGEAFFLGAGCEIPVQTPERNVLALSEFVRMDSPAAPTIRHGCGN